MCGLKITKITKNNNNKKAKARGKATANGAAFKMCHMDTLCSAQAKKTTTTTMTVTRANYSAFEVLVSQQTTNQINYVCHKDTIGFGFIYEHNVNGRDICLNSNINT